MSLAWMPKLCSTFGFALSVLVAQSVTTYHNDVARTGQNNSETILKTTNVNATRFGKLFAYPVDGAIIAQPLYLPSVTINSQIHNVVFVATENDSVYAFDADSNAGANANPLWHTSFIQPPNVIPVPSRDIAKTYRDIYPAIGVTGTPVIDQGKLFVVAKTKEISGTTVNYVQRLHSLDITTGLDTTGSPVVINPTFPGTCTPNDGQGNLTFSALTQNQRAALLAYNGVVYVAWASHGDLLFPYQGWVAAFNESDLQPYAVFNDDPDNSTTCTGGIWMSGSGPAVDAFGNIYLATGNGNFQPPPMGQSYGDSWVRFTPALLPMDFFTPHDQDTMDIDDVDLGSGGILLLPDQPGPYLHLMTGGGKEGTVYLVNRDNMGMYDQNGDVQIVQELPGIAAKGMWGSPVYYKGVVYFSGSGDFIKGLKLTNGQIAGM